MQPSCSTNAMGIDVSSYQGTIDWQQVSKSGISFAFMKATEGANLTDSMFHRNYAQAKAVGVLRGAYCFAHPGHADAKSHANYFTDVVISNGGFGEMPPVLDLEDSGGMENQTLAAWIRDWMIQVGSCAGKQPLLYTYPDFANVHLPQELSNIPLWIADYGVNQPKNSSGWSSWTFWQNSDAGSIHGISGKVDLDFYAGNVEDLHNAYAPQNSNSSQGTASSQASDSSSGVASSQTTSVVFVENHPYTAIVVGDVTHVLWSALDTFGTPHIYKGNGVMSINGKDVQGVIYHGDTYLPWNSLYSGVQAVRTWHFVREHE